MLDLRAVVDELAPAAGRPLLPGRLGWLPHVVVGLFAVMMAGVGWHTLVEDFGVANQGAAALAISQAVALPLALYWPMSGWWLSLALLVASALTASPEGGGGPFWPGPGLAVHLCVLALVALGVGARPLAGIWTLTLLAGLVLLPFLPGRDGPAGIAAMSAFSGAVLVTVGALRSRAEALNGLRTERRERARSQERTRIARELHDVVAHHLSVIAIQAEAGPHRPAADLPRAFTTIRQNALDAMAELHRVLQVLRSDQGADHAPQPTLALLDDLLAGVRGAGLDVGVRITGDRRPLPEGVELSAYRIVQEALSNVLKHAPDAPVEAVLDYRHDRLTLTITNGPSSASAHPAATGHVPKSTGHGPAGTRRGLDGSGRGSDGAGRGSDGAGRGLDGSGRGLDGAGRGSDGAGRGLGGGGRVLDGAGRGLGGVGCVLDGGVRGADGAGRGLDGGGRGLGGGVRGADGAGRGLDGGGHGLGGGGRGSEGGGHGLVGMRERAAMLGGELYAGPEPGGGFAVRAVLPLGWVAS